MTSKTPVSILQEMMSRLGNPPKYDLIYDGSGTHEALFKYKVYADTVTAIGTGRSKKEAKHEAARSALEKLAQRQIMSVEPEPENVEVMSPYKDKLNENAVGALHDLCLSYEVPMPEYEHVREEGPPHERIFTCVCSISKQRETGIGRTKKQAKQLAANSMLNRLKESLADIIELKPEVKEEGDADKNGEAVEPEVNSTMKEAVKKYLSVTSSPRKKVKLNNYPGLYHSALLSTPDDVVEDAIQLWKELMIECPKEEQESVDWEQRLENILEKMQVTPNYTKCLTSQSNPETESPVMVFLHLNTVPETVLCRIGSTEQQAKKSVIKACIEYFAVMMRKSAAALPEYERTIPTCTASSLQRSPFSSSFSSPLSISLKSSQ